jgi:hypothetical protein
MGMTGKRHAGYVSSRDSASEYAGLLIGFVARAGTKLDQLIPQNVLLKQMSYRGRSAVQVMADPLP